MTNYQPSTGLIGGGTVDMDELITMSQAWLAQSGDAGFNAYYDLNFDGKIDNADTDILSANWLLDQTPQAVEDYYYHYDGLGSCVALSDSSGDTVETYEYDVYGNVAIRKADGTILTVSRYGNCYLFTARRFDSETGLYYYRARLYDPYIGRFLQPDPIGYSGGVNWYLYCGNNPIMFIDPYGLRFKSSVHMVFDTFETFSALCTNAALQGTSLTAKAVNEYGNAQAPGFPGQAEVWAWVMEEIDPTLEDIVDKNNKTIKDYGKNWADWYYDWKDTLSNTANSVKNTAQSMKNWTKNKFEDIFDKSEDALEVTDDFGSDFWYKDETRKKIK
ncbi:MAG: RHS repeat-associated core domain-containing protein [Planctomycetota bacterium]|jgi:RHS repeat-associated protein